MASTIQLQQTIAWAAPFVNFRPLALGTNSEPAMSSANTILQTILGAPFAWPWNRKTVSFTTTAGQQDYSVAVSDLGYVELAAVNLPTGSAPNTFPMGIVTILGQATEQGRPHTIARQLDDDNGNLTFRLLPVPDQVYTVTITYQKAAPLFTSTIQTWAIPDCYSYIYQWGFLALMQMYADDPRFQVANQKFVATLLSAADGLDDQDKALFVSDWNNFTNTMMAGSMRKQQAVESLGAI